MCMKLLFLYLNTINEAYILIDKFYQKNTLSREIAVKYNFLNKSQKDNPYFRTWNKINLTLLFNYFSTILSMIIKACFTKKNKGKY